VCARGAKCSGAGSCAREHVSKRLAWVITRIGILDRAVLTQLRAERVARVLSWRVGRAPLAIQRGRKLRAGTSYPCRRTPPRDQSTMFEWQRQAIDLASIANAIKCGSKRAASARCHGARSAVGPRQHDEARGAVFSNAPSSDGTACGTGADKHETDSACALRRRRSEITP